MNNEEVGMPAGNEIEEAGNETEEFARFKLAGERFSGARLPIDALVELQRYRELVLESARHAWLKANPDEPLPEDFSSEFDLGISAIEDGSADTHLKVRPSAYSQYYEKGRTDFEVGFAEIVERNFDFDLELLRKDSLSPTEPDEGSISGDLIELVAHLALLPEFRDFGSSLRPEDTLELPATANRGLVHITPETVVSVIRPFAESVERALHPEPAAEVEVDKQKYASTVAGRLIALNADKRNFTISTLHFGEINGRYSDPDMTPNLKAVLNSSSQAPLVRITGRMSWRDEKLYRILGVDSVELLEIEQEPWSRRIVELANLAPGWHPEEDHSPVISFVAIDAARELLREVEGVPPTPGLYPQEDGGVTVEWGTPERVVTVEISPESEYSFFHLHVPTREVDEKETVDLSELKTLVRKALT